MPKASAAARSLLEQATKRWPKRDKASDGLLPSKAHHKQNPDSDHEKGDAVDLTRDDDFFTAGRLSRDLVADPRVKYVIYNGQIWSRRLRTLGWRKYRGANKHTKHIHVSIVHAKRNDTSPWPGVAIMTPAPTPKTGKVWTTAYWLHLRKGPGEKTRSLTLLKYHTNVTVLARGAEWTKVRVGPRTGWVASRYLAKG